MFLTFNIIVIGNDSYYDLPAYDALSGRWLPTFQTKHHRLFLKEFPVSALGFMNEICTEIDMHEIV
jgi:hypothetical protein